MPFKLSKTTPASSPSSRSVLFNGSSQYLSVGSIGNFNFLHNGLSDWTIEGWVYFNTLPGLNGKTLFSDGSNTSTDLGISLQFGGVVSNDFCLFISKGLSGGPSSIVGYGTGVGVFTNTNTWYHVAVTFNTSTKLLKLYVNGIATTFNVISGYQNSVGFAYSNSNSAYVMAIGRGQYSAPFGYFDGYMSNTRILNGTALYTASFTVPTSPLTAIANTSLLTCNSATIVDSSTNNFTITNNGSATVSSVVPFNAIGYGYKFKNRNNANSVLAGTQRAIFGYGFTNNITSITSLVSNTGVVATDTTGVGTARMYLAAAGYGTDKAIFGYGDTNPTVTSITNLVSNTGVVATDTTGVGTARNRLAAAGYGTDKAIFGYGTTGTVTAITNKVSNTGVVSTDTTGVGTARHSLAAAGYGSDKAIFGYGTSNFSNLVSNTGVVSTDTTGVGTSRYVLAAAGYGSDKAIFGYGFTTTYVSMTNLVSNTGVVATDTTGVGTARGYLAAAGYGTDKAIFGYGYGGSRLSLTNLVSNTGVVSTDTTGVGTARDSLAAAGFSTAGPAPNGLKFKKVYADPIVVYLTQKAIFGYGTTGTVTAVTNLVGNTGVVATDTTGVGTARQQIAAAGYG
jgi:hypothetical protein